MKKVITLVLIACMIFVFAACGKTEQPEVKDPTFVVGICQIAQHPALDAATQGFKDALTEALGADKVTFKDGDASGEVSNCTSIINDYVTSKVDLILANATAPLQAAAAATTTIPVLGTSITDYVSALELDNFNGTVGGNVSGTTDLAPLDQQAQMLHDWFPDKKVVGVIYCSAEANSEYQATTIKGYLEALGHEVKFFTFTDATNIAAVTEEACAKADVLYVPTDNTAANNTEAIANVVLPKKMPVVAGEEGICGGCGVCTLSISYYDLGVATGKMAAKILKGEASISEMPIESAATFTKKYQKDNCEALGLTAPADYVAIG